MNDALQALEVKVENGGATPQGKVFAKEWNVLVEAVKALDLKEFNEAALHKFLQDNGYITEDDIPTTDLSNVVTLATEQAIQGRKNFVGGVEVNGQELVYDAEKKVWQLTGDLIVTGAVTMFGNISGFTPSTIMDAVLVDGTTIAKNAQGQLTVIGGGGGNTGGLSVADLENYLSANKYTTEDAVSSLITEKLTGYATTDWVAQQGFAKQSDLTAVDNRLAAVEVFFATEDSDTLVNKWAEIVAFLNATEGDTLDSILSTKANKATTLAGYGITDAYTKAEINNTVSSLNSSIATKWTQDNGKIANWDSAFDWGNHASAGYAAKTYVDTELTKYVLKATAQPIEAQHNFVNGLQIGGLSITKSGGGANTIYLDANLVISGAFTMFGIGSTTFPIIWANIPFNKDQMSWDGSQWSVIGGGTGSVDDATVRVIVNEVLGEGGYATEKWVIDKDYATVSVVSSAISSALNPYALKTDIPTYTLRASSTIGKFYLQRNGVDSADVTINLPTSLPASDVYAWAKASSKPSYSWSEILSRPTALSQFTDDVGYATQSWVGNNYLSSTGGAINGSITANSFIGNLTGNADSATNADMLDNLHSSDFARANLRISSGSNINHIGYGYVENGNMTTGPMISYGADGTYFAEIQSYIGNETLHYRIHNDNGYGSVKTFAFTDSNVASATKLETEHTIWGQSFDGTKDINRELINCDFIRSEETGPDGYFVGLASKGAEPYEGLLLLSYGLTPITMYTASRERMRIHSNGNISIGGATADAKLHVHGDIFANSTISTSVGFHADYSVIYWAHDPVNFAIGWGSENRLKYMGFYGHEFFVRDGEVLRLSADKQVLIGGDTTINGDLIVTGAITMFSQLSMKNVIDYDGLSLAQLEQIKPARFTWKDGRDNRIHIGGIADYIQPILPEVVYETVNKELTVDYGSAAFYIGTSLIKPVIDHERRIADLERENQQLKQQLEQLKVA